MKYKLDKSDSIEYEGYTLYRVVANENFCCNNKYAPHWKVKSGMLGGYIESEENLSHIGGCWISSNSKVYGNARVEGNACIVNSIVSDSSLIDGNTYLINVTVSGSFILDEYFENKIISEYNKEKLNIITEREENEMILELLTDIESLSASSRNKLFKMIIEKGIV